MKVEYLPSFFKDLKALKSTPIFEQIKREKVWHFLDYAGLREVYWRDRNLLKLTNRTLLKLTNLASDKKSRKLYPIASNSPSASLKSLHP